MWFRRLWLGRKTNQLSHPNKLPFFNNSIGFEIHPPNSVVSGQANNASGNHSLLRRTMLDCSIVRFFIAKVYLQCWSV